MSSISFLISASIKQVLSKYGKAIADSYEVEAYRGLPEYLQVFSCLDKDKQNLVKTYIFQSKSQLGQDIFALACKGNREPGFFVEFGATDGLTLSNTWLLEKCLGWNGILAEPAKYFHSDLRKTRDCILDYRCVYKNSGVTVQFLEASDNGLSLTEYSTISGYENRDQHEKSRQAAPISYDVDCISLEDLLATHGAPRVIDFLSIDTEGSEFDILNLFNFGKNFIINSICVEHNNDKIKRDQIFKLLTKWGLVRVMPHLSRWDDWYVAPYLWKM